MDLQGPVLYNTLRRASYFMSVFGRKAGNMKKEGNLDFTVRAKESFLGAVKDPYFRDRDSGVIFDLLRSGLRIVPFGDYLKRYIYRKAELQGDYAEIPVSVYQEILCEEFRERQVPCSFTPSSLRLRNAAKNWLEQQAVNRQVVLLLGFGLGMDAGDVDMFLTKALQEYGLDAKDPFEALCLYCYRNRLGYPKFEELWEAFRAAGDGEGLSAAGGGNLDRTARFREKLSGISGEAELFAFLDTLPGARRQGVSARQAFDRLYGKACGIVAGILTAAEADTAEKNAGRIREALSREDRLYDCEKIRRVEGEKERHAVYTREQVTPADLEDVILSAVPKDTHGNLASLKGSALEKQFLGKRLSRQRLAEILAGDAPVTRYDLLTLLFFVYSQEDTGAKDRYLSFLREANRTLEECGFGPVYVANPYECFLLMCLLAEDPLGTYADVWELSYDPVKTGITGIPDRRV